MNCDVIREPRRKSAASYYWLRYYVAGFNIGHEYQMRNAKDMSTTSYSLIETMIDILSTFVFLIILIPGTVVFTKGSQMAYLLLGSFTDVRLLPLRVHATNIGRFWVRCIVSVVHSIPPQAVRPILVSRETIDKARNTTPRRSRMCCVMR